MIKFFIVLYNSVFTITAVALVVGWMFSSQDLKEREGMEGSKLIETTGTDESTPLDRKSTDSLPDMDSGYDMGTVM